jgi:hypothetical protein
MTDAPVTVEEMIATLECWKKYSDFPGVFDAIRATLTEHAALKDELDASQDAALGLTEDYRRLCAKVEEWGAKIHGLSLDYMIIHPQDWDCQMFMLLDEIRDYGKERA